MQLHQLMDLGIFCIAFYLAFFTRQNWVSFRPAIEENFGQYSWLYFAIVPLVLLVLPAQGFYNRPLFGSRREMIWSLFKSCTIVTIGVVLVMYFIREHLARAVVPLFGGYSFALVLLKEEFLRFVLKTSLVQASFKRRFVIAGNKLAVRQFKAGLRHREMEGIEFVAEVDLSSSTIADLVSTLHVHSANGVVLIGDHTYFETIEKALQACELEGVEAWLVADFFKTQNSRTTFDEFYGRPVMVFRTAPEVAWQGMVKQTVDFIGAFLFLALFWPVLLVVALLVKWSSPGPILFRQQRCGLNGQPFTMLKFRSMTSDAEQRKHELEALNEMRGPVFKLSNDPRVTPVGRFLRRLSIDEWPQFFNVLKGEMSLVGPRPLPVDEVKRFDDLAHRRRLSVKPGLTCTWQVSGRNEVQDFKEWVKMDLDYIDNWSLWLDFKIMWRTIPAVLTGWGAK